MALTIDTSLITSIVNVLYIAIFVVLFLYGQRLQLSFMQRGIKGQLSKLYRMQTKARISLLGSLRKFGSASQSSPSEGDGAILDHSVDRLLDSFVISPVSMDPRGIVPKLEHILDTADKNLRGEIKRIAPAASESEVQTLSNVAEIAVGLNNMYKVVRHFYLLGTKSGGTFSMVQLQVIMPQIMESAEAYSSALDAFVGGKIIGDGFGPLVASELASRNQPSPGWSEVAKDTEVAKLQVLDHNVYVVKAKGPGGNVGKPAEAIQKILRDDPSVKYVLTVDAALKLEGEQTGSIAEGIGAAIGGPGVERFRIEEKGAESKIEMLALVAKMSEKEAITEIPKQVREGVAPTIERIKEIITDMPSGSSIIVAGIGNTLGVA